MAVTNSINTKNQTITIISGTGSIGIGDDAAAKSITIGTNNTTNVQTISSGTGGINIGNDSIDKTINIGTGASTGTIAFKAGTGGISIGNDGVAKTITIGSATSGFSYTINGGTGGINIGNDGVAKTITIGNFAGASGSISVSCGTGGISIGNDSIDKTTTIGSTTNSTSITFNAGTVAGSSGDMIFPALDITGTTATLAIGVYHIADNASQVTLTLPTTAALGTYIRVVGKGSGGWLIAQNASQVINSTAASTTTGTGGSLASGGRYDAVDLICTAANTSWSIMSTTGTLTFV